jgi:hypothetical protein
MPALWRAVGMAARMTSFEFTVSTISDADGKDRTGLFRAQISRHIEIYLPTANGPVLGLAEVLSVEGTEARVRGTVGELAAAQLEDLVAPHDWRQPTMEMFGAAVRNLVITDDRPPTLLEETQGKGQHMHTPGGDPTCDICVALVGL